MNSFVVKSKKAIVSILPFLLSILGALLSFAVTMVLSRSFGSQRYGQIQYWLGIINTFSSFTAFGLPNFLIRDANKYNDKKIFFGFCTLLISSINLIAFPIFFLISYFAFAELYKNVILIVFIILSSFTTSLITIVNYELLVLEKKNLATFIGNVGFKLLLLIVSLLMILLSFQTYLFDYFVLIYFIIHVALLIVPIIKYSRFGVYKLSKAQIKSLLFFFLLTITSATYLQISKIMLGEAGKGDYTLLAVYSISIQILTSISAVTRMIVDLARPKFAILCANNDEDRIKKLYMSSLRITARIATPFFIGILCQGDFVLSLFGKGYSGYPLILILCACAYLVCDLFGPAGTLMSMDHLENKELLIDLIQFGIFLILGISLLMVVYYAIPLAILVSQIIAFSLRIIFIYKKRKFFVLDKRSIIEILIEGVVSFAIFFSLGFINNFYLKLTLDIVVGIILIIVFNLISVNKEDLLMYFKTINSKE